MKYELNRGDRWALRVLWLFTLVAIFGFATFGSYPSLLGRFPSVAWMYSYAFSFFASGQVWIAMGVMAFFLWRKLGARWLTAFAALYVLSLGSELTGTSTGFPFGDYEYTSLMDPKWFELVPITIPLSWFYMALASWALAAPFSRNLAVRVILGSLILTSWDLALDPAMSYATRYWTWGVEGGYYGMPAINLLGWFVTGLVLMGALALLGTHHWVDRLPLGWLASFYLANLVLPIGMNAAAGLWGAVAISAVVGLLGWWALRRARTPSGAGRPGLSTSALEAV